MAAAKKYDLYSALLAGLMYDPWKKTTWIVRKPKPKKKKPAKKGGAK